MGVDSAVRFIRNLLLVLFAGLLFWFPGYLAGDDGGAFSFALPETDVSERPAGVQGVFGFRMIPSSERDGEQLGLTASENVWACFPPGSWVRFERTLTSGSGLNPVKSVTEIKFVLKSVGTESYALERSVVVHTGGRDLTRPPETIEYNFFNTATDSSQTFADLACDSIEVKRMGVLRDVIDISRVLPCYVRVYNKKSGNRREETKFWYSSVTYPHILKQESRIYLVPDEPNEEEALLSAAVTNARVSSFNFRLGLVKDWVTETVMTDASGRVRREATTLHSGKIPGGVLEESSVEYDVSGNQVRSDLRLLDYYIVPK